MMLRHYLTDQRSQKHALREKISGYYVDRHYNHSDDTYPLAHNPVTSHDVSGPVRFPVDRCLYRRYEELTHWEEYVHQHFPDRPISAKKKERARLHKEVDLGCLKMPFRGHF